MLLNNVRSLKNCKQYQCMSPQQSTHIFQTLSSSTQQKQTNSRKEITNSNDSNELNNLNSKKNQRSPFVSFIIQPIVWGGTSIVLALYGPTIFQNSLYSVDTVTQGCLLSSIFIMTPISIFRGFKFANRSDFFFSISFPFVVSLLVL